MSYALMHNNKGEWWVVEPQGGNRPDKLVYLLKATSHQQAKREARKLRYNV
jgi:hypothetical protein